MGRRRGMVGAASARLLGLEAVAPRRVDIDDALGAGCATGAALRLRRRDPAVCVELAAAAAGFCGAGHADKGAARALGLLTCLVVASGQQNGQTSPSRGYAESSRKIS